MMDKILCYVQGWLGVRHYLRIPASYLRQCALQSKASSWHSYAIRQRPWRPHVCVPCGWITQLLPRSAHIFEAGCGSGANLLWLWQEGFRNLSGNDICANAVHMCQLLGQYRNSQINAFVDDALQPQHPPQNVDALLSVNWLYHIPGTSLGQFLQVYRECLAPKGYIVFDCISTRYNHMPNNQYHTKDWKLPEAQRRPSEYVFRMSRQEVQQCIAEHGFSLVRYKKLRAWPPRDAYMIQLCA